MRLEPIDPARHQIGLFVAAGEPEIWEYLPYGPFEDEAALAAQLTANAASEDPLFYAIIDLRDGRAGGVASYLRITPDHGVIEIGHIWFGLGLQRTREATEAIYLLARHAFDDLGYRRLEWKCNAANAALPQRSGALRLHVRGHLPPAPDRQGPEPRHRLVRDPRSRVARDPGGLRGLARRRRTSTRRVASGDRSPTSAARACTDPFSRTGCRLCEGPLLPQIGAARMRARPPPVRLRRVLPVYRRPVSARVIDALDHRDRPRRRSSRLPARPELRPEGAALTLASLAILLLVVLRMAGLVQAARRGARSRARRSPRQAPRSSPRPTAARSTTRRSVRLRGSPGKGTRSPSSS